MEGNSNLALILPTTFTSLSNALYSGSNYILVVKATTVPSIAGTNRVKEAYVPDESVADYKAATNWSAIAAKIYPLSQYTGSIVSPVWQVDP